MDTVLDTARLFLADAAEAALEAMDYAALLDLAMARAEFEHTLGEPFEAEVAWSRAVEVLRSTHSVGPWLYRGAAQAAWVARRMGVTRGIAPLDDCVAGWIEEYPVEGFVDLPRGLLGLGVAMLEHPDDAVRDKLTARVLDVVEERTAVDADGRYLPPTSVETGHLIGLAHGAAGLVAYLAGVCAAELPCSLRAAQLLDATTAWLLARRNPVDGTLYPRSVETRHLAARSAWCHGDPGVWIGLTASATVTGSAQAVAAAAEVARAIVARAPAATGVVDATICHGSAGLLWITHRIERATGDAAAATRVEHWVRQIREQRATGPLVYFGVNGMTRNPTFLEGDAGVALVLLQVATGTRPAWERLLLGGEVGS